MAIEPIKRQNVSDLVFHQIQNMIVNGEWGPGSKIPSENELAAQMGVSRVTIRSAIQKLSSLGLVESRHGEGTFVCKLDGTQSFNSMRPMIALSKMDREALHELRTVIESACARLAAQRIQSEQLAQLRRDTDQMEAYQDNPEVSAEYDMAFHKDLANATGNPYIIQIFDILESIFIRSMVENIHLMGASSGIGYHRKICDALELRNGDLACKWMEEHLEVTRQTMLRLREETP